MWGIRHAMVAATLSCVSCTTWFVNFDDTAGAHHRKRWLGCAGRCDPALQTLVTKEDTQAALDKLGRALDTLPAYEHAIAAQIHWDRAILFEARGEWQAALVEVDTAAALDASPVYAEERALLRRKLGVTNEPPKRRDVDSLSEVDDAEVAEKCKCLEGQRDDPPDEASFVTLVEPGRGIGPIRLGASTPEHVVRVYGCDCRVTKRRDGAVTAIDYSFVDAKGGVGTASHRPDRPPNAARPAMFVFDGGVVTRIGLNIYQRDLATSGGLRVRAPKADVTRVLGAPYRVESSRLYEKYIYRDPGIDVWIAHANDTVGAIHVYK